MPRKKPLTAEQLMKNTSYRLPFLSPDNGKLLFTSDQQSVPNVFEMSLRDGTVSKLTDFEDPVYPMGYASDTRRFLFMMDEGGNERFHLYLQDGDECTDLTKDEEAVAHLFSWNEDRSGFYFTWNRRDSSFFDLWYMELDSLEHEMVYENKRYNIAAVDLSGSLVALILENSSNDSDIYLYERASGIEKLLTPHSGDVIFGAAGFSRDGSRLFLLTDEGAEFKYLSVLDLDRMERSAVSKYEGDVQRVIFSDDLEQMAITVGIRGRTRMYLRDLKTEEEFEVSGLPAAGY